MESDADKLRAKLGLKVSLKAYLLHAPGNYKELLVYPHEMQNLNEIGAQADWIQAFYTDSKTLEDELPRLKASIKPTGQIWISWPKKSSKIKSDLSDQIVRMIGLATVLVDVKIAAIDDTWSGLKFVYRTKDR